MELAKVVLKKGVLLGINYLLNSRSAEKSRLALVGGMDTLSRDGHTVEG